ncbi:MAG: TetR/AcrR family transcriptional regulator [Oscillospiraceae bacterium]|nr:TetR/AcrR family transcriptional regulator [Oscillospiraceae bacterium]
MPKKRTYIRSEKTKKRIKDAFIKLSEENGTDQFTIEQLCRECGIVRSSFYLYYDSRHALLDEIEWDLIEGLRDINTQLSKDLAADTGLERGRALGLLNLRFIKEHMASFKALMRPDGFSSFANKWCGEIESEYERQFRKTAQSPEQLALAKAIWSRSLIGAYQSYIFSKTKMQETEIAAELVELLKLVTDLISR